MKKIVLSVLIAVIVTATVLVGGNYILTMPKVVTDVPNADIECGQGSCLPSNTNYGNSVGDTIENYELTDFDGNKVNLYDLMEGYDKIIIALEADWCGDCHRQDDKIVQANAVPENALMIPIFTTYSKPDDEERTATYDSAKEYAVSRFAGSGITPYFDEGNKIWDEFNAVGTPTNISLDSNGRIKLISLEVDADTILLENTETIPRTLE